LKSQTVRMFTTFLVSGVVIIGMTTSVLADNEGPEPSLVFLDIYLDSLEGSKMPEYVAGIHEEIAQYRKFALMPRADALEQIRRQMVSSERRVNDKRLRQIEKLVKDGDKLLYTNRQKAIEVLRKANAQLQGLSESLRLDTNIRNYYFKTKMLLVESHRQNKSTIKARAIMSEVIRLFESAYLNRINDDNFHPKTVQLFKEVFREMETQRTSQLTVITTPPGCDVYINGQPQKDKTPNTFDRQYPGEVMVQVQKGDQQSMVHKVTLPPDSAAEIKVDLAFEAALKLSNTSLGLTFKNKAALVKNMGKYASRVARTLKVDYVATLGLISSFDGPVLAASVFRARDGKLIRETTLTVKANVVSERRIREIAAFVADVEANAGAEWYKNVYGWSLVGAGSISLAVSMAFLSKYLGHKDHAEDPDWPTGCKVGCKEKRNVEASKAQDAQMLAGILAGVGGALAVGGVLVFIFDTEDAPDAATTAEGPSRFVAGPIILPGGGGVTATWRF
jgi:hypothetical protein